MSVRPKGDVMTGHFGIVICPTHGRVPLSYEQFDDQLENVEAPWTCPHCGAISDFDDTGLS